MHGQQQCNTCSTCMFILLEGLAFKKSSGLMPRLNFFLILGVNLLGKAGYLLYHTQLLNHYWSTAFISIELEIPAITLLITHDPHVSLE